ncbi:HaeIII family restriction endonuclease [Candidatus Contubernalis alkaliaceticus]|uniref:HaeIII family restriction endonuclease n=1 Tax=Candidatus Contubernalis alkaliaceticus TaxID=338645 RepID=UPI001F4C2892|nr:HaeIII family restriction endonuclease [Candidatus Contubernalis alkalaceticus]UNC91287.1 HaeIII family restriction endonuclease [Candidatus Contubernalis alkalaceticus]
MPTQNIRGKAFEYACLSALYTFLNGTQPVEIVASSSVEKAHQSYFNLSNRLRESMDLAADAAVRVLIRLEPQLENFMENIPLYLEIQPDSQGQVGDVRDILALRRQNNWEIGLSAKHNHAAVKHSRLSQTIDFGDKWLQVPCSYQYFTEINPYFTRLSVLREQRAEWNSVPDKAQEYYIPILDAFIRELQSIYEQHGAMIPQRLLSYLLGRYDFYKIIAHKSTRTTEIQGFSLYGTLNNQAGGIRPQVRMPRVRLPSRFHSIDYKPGSDNTIFIVCDEGWTISARLHNARTLVEPSVKFDITLIGVPPSLYRHHEPW